MMAAILFLFLTVFSLHSIAFQSEVYSPSGNGPKQTLLQEKISASNNYQIGAYRGAEYLMHNTVAIFTENSIGSGVVLRDSAVRKYLPFMSKYLNKDLSVIITNFHVISEKSKINLMYAPKRNLDVDSAPMVNSLIVASDPDKDLSILVAPAKPDYVQGVVIADLDSISIGDDVEAIGHPSGELWSYTRGYISQIRKNYEWNYSEEKSLKADVLQTQTPINPGNSGGPLFNKNAQLVGINAFGNPESQGLNYSLHISNLFKLEPAYIDMIEKNKIKKSFNPKDMAKLFSLNYRMISSERDNGKLYQLYESIDSEFRFVSIFNDNEQEPIIIYKTDLDGQTVDIVLNTKHNNPNAYFYVEVFSDDELAFSGWDFDGDFVIDYVM